MVWLLFAPADKTRYTGKVNVVVTHISKKRAIIPYTLNLHMVQCQSTYYIVVVLDHMYVIIKVEIIELLSASCSCLVGHSETLTS